MQSSPLQHKLQRAPWKFTFKNPQSINLVRCMEFAVNSVEMSGRMVVEEHADDDSVESADGGHSSIMMTRQMAESGGLAPARNYDNISESAMASRVATHLERGAELKPSTSN